MVHLNSERSDSVHALQVVRVPGGARYKFTMASDSPVVIATHWVGRRLWSPGSDHELASGLPTRHVAYAVVIAWLDTGPAPFLLEVTCREMDGLERECQACGLVFGPGLVFEVSRNKAKSPLRLHPVSDEGDTLSAFAPVRRAINAAAVLAGVSVMTEGESLSEYMDRIRPHLATLLGTALAQNG